ncbi:MAG: hypothetical protein PVF18_10955 [Anaerolineales bacterium]|jgi:hypothetical protein
MSLIDRYIHEVGRHLPRKNRMDIQAELRSAIQDALEDRYGPDPSENEVIVFLKEFGSPRAVAASYYPEGQYLIGPALFPLFRLVVGIALAGVLGAQILAWGVAIFIAGDSLPPLEAIAGLINSLPMTFGMVVIVFAILQRFDVQPSSEEESWDPSDLPELDASQPVKRGERIFGLVAGTLILAYLVFFPQYIGFITAPGGEFIANPVIPDYIVWISVSLVASIALDIYLLWQGRWSTIARLARIGVNIISIVVLTLLVQAHTEWLAARGVSGWVASLERFASDIQSNWQVFGMQAFRIAFGVALIVITIETLVLIFRLVQASFETRSYERSITEGEL